MAPSQRPVSDHKPNMEGGDGRIEVHFCTPVGILTKGVVPELGKMKRKLLRRRPPRKHPENSKAIGKWGQQVMRSGFTIVPNMLLFNQDRLKLTPNEINVLLHLMSYWWEKDRLPYPSKTLISTRMGKDNRTIQRTFKSLEAKGFLSRQLRYPKGNRKTSAYDLSGLIRHIEGIKLKYADYRE